MTFTGTPAWAPAASMRFGPGVVRFECLAHKHESSADYTRCTGPLRHLISGRLGLRIQMA